MPASRFVRFRVLRAEALAAGVPVEAFREWSRRGLLQPRRLREGGRSYYRADAVAGLLARLLAPGEGPPVRWLRWRGLALEAESAGLSPWQLRKLLEAGLITARRIDGRGRALFRAGSVGEALAGPGLVLVAGAEGPDDD